jgi:acyl dehydratase
MRRSASPAGLPRPPHGHSLPSRAARRGREDAVPGLHYEDFTVGQVFEHELSRTVTEADNTLFSLLTMNPQPLHIDAHFAAGTEWGQRLFNSLATLAIMIGISVHDTTIGTTIGNLGMSEVRFPKPVFHGDTLRARTRIVSKRESRSRPDAGLVEFEHEAINQRGEVVAMCRRVGLMRRRQSGPVRDATA